MTTQHTPTPWSRVGTHIEVQGRWIANTAPSAIRSAKTAQAAALARHPEDDANAAFIVLAVNSHDALLAAARAVAGTLEHPNPYVAWKGYEGDAQLEQLRAAIAAAEGRTT